ncbi:MAG TPA: hypothetical protein VHY08_07235, partial [Bacillota bacterium]|nr:hypothetical protein [Bacillota bacterium]
MTKREQHLVILVAVVITGWMVFRFWPRNEESSKGLGNGNYQFSMNEADRLLRSRLNISARNKAVRDELKIYRSRFYNSDNPENAKIDLLKTVEGLATQTGLTVQQKNIVNTHDDTIGVTLEGKTGPEPLIRFLQSTSQNTIGLRIQRLQIH